MFFKNDVAQSLIINYLNDAGISPEELMVHTSGEFLIFGGAVRDAMAGEATCNDIDILVKEKVAKKVLKGFNVILTGDDYKMVNHIRIQKTKSSLITKPFPYLDMLYKRNCDTLMGMLGIIIAVDINVNGIAWHPYGGFIEVIPNSIQFCSRKVFYVNKKSHGYDQTKIEERKEKLISKGWLEVVL